MTASAGRSAQPLGASLVSHLDVIWALIRRDIQSRFAGNFLGFGWSYVAPLIWIAVTYFAFQFFGRRVPVYTDTITFIISGLVPYVGFRFIVNNVTRVNNALRRLLIFPTVTMEHGVVAAALIECANILIVFAVVASANYVVFGNGELDDPVQWLVGMALAAGLGASYGYLFVALTEFNPTFRQLANVILRPAFFISGVFFTANELPERVLPFFIWNPLLHAVDIARSGMLLHYETRVASALYAIVWIVALAGIAAIIRMSQRS